MVGRFQNFYVKSNLTVYNVTFDCEVQKKMGELIISDVKCIVMLIIAYSLSEHITPFNMLRQLNLLSV